MNEHALHRRRFLMVAIALAGATALEPALLRGARAWAAGDREALLRIIRLLYPHDAIGDEVYADVLDQSLSLLAEDRSLDRLLEDAASELDAALANDFLEASPEQQIAALKAVQDRPYFTGILGAVANRLYSQTGTWSMMGYDGPSYEKGGYIDRGSGDIDWLPEGSS